MLYILDGKTPVHCNDVLEWAIWKEKNFTQIARDEFDGVLVSTIFVGVDMGFYEHAPMLFETFVFVDDKCEGDTGRYSTWEQAEAGHQAAVALMRRKLIESQANGTKALDTIMGGAEQDRKSHSGESNSDKT